MSPLAPRPRWYLVLGGLLLTLLLAAVFTFGSLDMPFEPQNWREVMALYAVSSFITAALLVFGLILARSIVRLWAERRKHQLGARFKTKMVVGATGLALLPIVFMFFVSYSLLNRTLGRWFPRPLEISAEQSQSLLSELGQEEQHRLALAAGAWLKLSASSSPSAVASSSICTVADAFWTVSRAGNIDRFIYCRHESNVSAPNHSDASAETPPVLLQILPSGAEVWRSGASTLYLAGNVPAPQGGFALAARSVPADFLQRWTTIHTQFLAYDQQKQNLRALKRQMLLILLLFTMLLLFAVMWLALFLAKQVTVPIQALAEGTREVSAGNFDYQVPEQSQDELGVLVRSFNTMTTQLRDSRAQIDQFTRNLQQAVQEIERRRQIMETVLENIPTGVLSLGPDGSLLRANSAIARMFGAAGRELHSLEEVFGQEGARSVQHLMRRSLRMGVASREIELQVSGRLMHAAVTASSLGPRRANTGYVLVVDDLSELLRSQKSAAWQEVARRIAHEIKNPLTPIQLSAQRLSRYLDRRQDSANTVPSPDPELTQLVHECSRLIEREVGTLAGLVNEFSQFVRFPTAKLAPTNANIVVHEAIEVFSGRLDGITMNTTLAENLPYIRADGNLLRSVVVNLIDNAAEALEDSPVRQIHVATRTNAEADTVEIRVEDTGHGISPEDKDKLFLPHFSTKARGTGLGLAIAARIVAEHGGSIHVEDNSPVGSRFLVELPIPDSYDRPAT